MTLTSEVLAPDDAKMSNVLPQLNPSGNFRSTAPTYTSSPLEDKVQVLVETPSRFNLNDAIARGYPSVPSALTTSCTLEDAVNYGMPLSAGSWPYDAARNYDGIYSWPSSPRGVELASPLCYNQLVPVAAPLCYGSIVPMSPPSLALEQHVEHLHCELQQAREDAKDDVLRCAREAARGLAGEAPLRKENEQLRSRNTTLEASLEEALAKFAKEREQLILEKQVQLDEFAAERNKRRASLDRASSEIETSIANAKAQAHAEVEVLQAQLAALVANQQRLVDDNTSLQETGRKREEAISSLQRMLEEERKRMRLLQSEFESLKVDGSRKFDISEVEDLRSRLTVSRSEEQRLGMEIGNLTTAFAAKEASLIELRQKLDQERDSNRQLQRDLDQARVESEAKVVKMKEQAGSNMEELQQRWMQLANDNHEVKSKVAERELTIASLKQSVDFKEQCLEQLKCDLDGLRIERDALKRTESLLQGAESEQIEKLRKQIDEMAAQRDQLNQDVLSMKSAQLHLERANEGLRASLDEERLKSSGMAQLKDDNERLKLEIFNAKGKDVEREMAIASLKQSVDFKDKHIERLNGDLELSRNERDAGIQKESLRFGAQSEQVEKLQKQLDDLSAQREELNQKLISADSSQLQCERTIHSLRGDVEAEKNKVIALELDLQAARSESKDNVIGAQGELDSMRRKLQDASDENEDLRMALQRSDDELLQYRSGKQANRQSLDMNQRQSNSGNGLTNVKMERDVADLINHVGETRALSSSPNGGGKVTSLSNLREVFDVQHRNIQELQKELQAVKSERDAVVRGTTTKRGSVDELVDVRRQLASAESELETLRVRLKEKTDKEARSSVTDVVGLRKQVSTLENENSQLRTERQSLVDKADQAKRQSLGEVLELRQRLSVAEAEVQQRKAAEDFARSTSRTRNEAKTSPRKVDFEVSAEGRTGSVDVDLTQDDEGSEYDVDLTHEGDVKLSTRTSSWMEKSMTEEPMTFAATPPARRSDARDSYSGSPVERKKLSMSSRGSGK